MSPIPRVTARALPIVGIALAGVAGCTVDGASGGRAWKDCLECPAVVRVPPGVFQMGAPETETGQPGWPPKAGGNERPVHQVSLAREFGLGIHEVTVREFAAFSAATGYSPPGGCLAVGSMRNGAPTEDPALNWRQPGFSQADNQPVVCVSWNDAAAYVAWLARRTGKAYRLPSEAEWEYAARAGSTTPYFFGEAGPDACKYANTATAPEVVKRGGVVTEGNFMCDDGAAGLSPAGSYRPNGIGLHDMHGNVFEWTADCNHPGYVGAPTDGRPWLDERPCVFRAMRGGSAYNGPRQNRAASRGGRPASGRASNLGFRVALSLGDDAPSPAADGPVAVATTAIVPDGTEAGALFARHCAGCHVDRATFRGVYGSDRDSVVRTIRTGGANTMSMPAWEGVLSSTDIEALADYVRRIAGWQPGPDA